MQFVVLKVEKFSPPVTGAYKEVPVALVILYEVWENSLFVIFGCRQLLHVAVVVFYGIVAVVRQFEVVLLSFDDVASQTHGDK